MSVIPIKNYDMKKIDAEIDDFCANTQYAQSLATHLTAHMVANEVLREQIATITADKNDLLENWLEERMQHDQLKKGMDEVVSLNSKLQKKVGDLEHNIFCIKHNMENEIKELKALAFSDEAEGITWLDRCVEVSKEVSENYNKGWDDCAHKAAEVYQEDTKVREDLLQLVHVAQVLRKQVVEEEKCRQEGIDEAVQECLAIVKSMPDSSSRYFVNKIIEKFNLGEPK